MREIQASEAKTHLPQLLDAVERGETVVITRHGRAIARIVPEAEHRQAEIRTAIEGIKALRRGGATVSPAEIGASINPGRTD
jgi:prevent-host-death family protein